MARTVLNDLLWVDIGSGRAESQQSAGIDGPWLRMMLSLPSGVHPRAVCELTNESGLGRKHVRALCSVKAPLRLWFSG